MRELLQDVRVAVIALALDLSQETINDLIHVPREARVILLAESINLLASRTSCTNTSPLDEPIKEIILNSASANALPPVDVLIHSLRARTMVNRVAPPGSRLLELHFVPNPTSLNQIRQAIQQRLSGSRVLEEVVGREVATLSVG